MCGGADREPSAVRWIKNPVATRAGNPRDVQGREAVVSRRLLWLLLRDWFEGTSGGWSCHIAAARAIAAMVLPRASQEQQRQRQQTLRVEVAGSGHPLIRVFPYSSSTTVGVLRDAVAGELARKPTFSLWQTFGLYRGHGYSLEDKLSPLTKRLVDVPGMAGGGDAYRIVSVVIHCGTAAKALAAWPWARKLGWDASVQLKSWSGVTVSGEGKISKLLLNDRNLSGQSLQETEVVFETARVRCFERAIAITFPKYSLYNW